MKENKQLEYYLDSKNNGSKDIQKQIEKIKAEFVNREINVNITLNDYGVYLITFKIKNRNTYFNKLKAKIENRKKLYLKEGNENYSIEKKYGRYKETKKYYPI